MLFVKTVCPNTTILLFRLGSWVILIYLLLFPARSYGKNTWYKEWKSKKKERRRRPLGPKPTSNWWVNNTVLHLIWRGKRETRRRQRWLTKNNLHTNQTTRDLIGTINYNKHLIQVYSLQVKYDKIGSRFDLNTTLKYVLTWKSEGG